MYPVAHRGISGLGLIRHIGIYLSVHIVSNRFDYPCVLEREGALMGADKGEELTDGCAAFQVHQVRIPPLHDPGVYASRLHHMRDICC